MIDKEDIRYTILLKLNSENKGTNEFRANEYLATLHNDLGTIRRALIDLIEDGYIKESNVGQQDQSVIFAINSKGTPDRKKSSRLLNDNDIKPIRIYLTLKGKKFLIESENLKHTSWNIRNEMKMRFLFLIIGAVPPTVLFIADKIISNKKPQTPIEVKVNCQETEKQRGTNNDSDTSHTNKGLQQKDTSNTK